MTGAGTLGHRRLAVVSGGGTGIGRACAAALAGDGLDVVLLGRRREVLSEAGAAAGARPRCGGRRPRSPRGRGAARRGRPPAASAAPRTSRRGGPPGVAPAGSWTWW